MLPDAMKLIVSIAEVGSAEKTARDETWIAE
jgi:hypothetical protein